MMTKVSEFDVACVAKAIYLSEKSAASGESPFGAVVANQSTVLADGSNRTRSSGNPTQHAELVALNSFFDAKTEEPTGILTLYASCEPCLMCLGAAHYSGIKRIVYGVDVRDILVLGSDDPNYSARPVADVAGLEMEILSGVLKDKAFSVLQKFSLTHGGL